MSTISTIKIVALSVDNVFSLTSSTSIGFPIMKRRAKNLLNEQGCSSELESREMLAGTLNENSSVQQIVTALEGGGDVTFSEGTYNLSSRVRASISRDVNVTAEGANFVSNGIDGDLFTLVGTNGRTDSNIKWTGGSFDISESRLSTTRPFRSTSDSLRAAEAGRTGSNREGVSATSDGLSIRGNDRIGDVRIDDVSVRGSDSSWRRNAGGDSGVFIADVDDLEVTNSEFRGIRDAGVYISDTPGTEGTTRALIENNLVINSYDGVTAKRGIDNVTFRNNVLVNNDVGASLKINQVGRDAGERFENARFVGNFSSNSAHANILLEDADDVELLSNNIFTRSGGSQANRDRNAIRITSVEEADGTASTFSDLSSGNTITSRAANSTETDAAFTARSRRE